MPIYDKSTDTVAVINPNGGLVNVPRATLGLELDDRGDLKTKPEADLKDKWRLATTGDVRAKEDAEKKRKQAESDPAPAAKS